MASLKINIDTLMRKIQNLRRFIPYFMKTIIYYGLQSKVLATLYIIYLREPDGTTALPQFSLRLAAEVEGQISWLVETS
jgi:hypothetical protein